MTIQEKFKAKIVYDKENMIKNNTLLFYEVLEEKYMIGFAHWSGIIRIYNSYVHHYLHGNLTLEQLYKKFPLENDYISEVYRQPTEEPYITDRIKWLDNNEGILATDIVITRLVYYLSMLGIENEDIYLMQSELISEYFNWELYNKMYELSKMSISELKRDYVHGTEIAIKVALRNNKWNDLNEEYPELSLYCQNYVYGRMGESYLIEMMMKIMDEYSSWIENIFSTDYHNCPFNDLFLIDYCVKEKRKRNFRKFDIRLKKPITSYNRDERNNIFETITERSLFIHYSIGIRSFTIFSTIVHDFIQGIITFIELESVFNTIKQDTSIIYSNENKDHIPISQDILGRVFFYVNCFGVEHEASYLYTCFPSFNEDIYNNLRIYSEERIVAEEGVLELNEIEIRMQASEKAKKEKENIEKENNANDVKDKREEEENKKEDKDSHSEDKDNKDKEKDDKDKDVDKDKDPKNQNIEDDASQDDSYDGGYDDYDEEEQPEEPQQQRQEQNQDQHRREERRSRSPSPKKSDFKANNLDRLNKFLNFNAIEANTNIVNEVENMEDSYDDGGYDDVSYSAD